MNLDQLLSKRFPTVRSNYSTKDVMLYALGVGACTDPLNVDDLRFVFEQNLQALPSFSCVVAHPGAWYTAPELQLDSIKLLHAEQHFTLERPLPTSGELVSHFDITGVVDKGVQSGALVYLRKTLRSADDRLIGTVSSALFFRADGGCGSWGTPGAALEPVPDRPADGIIDMPSLAIAGLIYRLSGDFNPLHADPTVARKAGFEKPILHGLCTYGIACQSLVRALGDHDATRLRGMSARFTKTVYPGETIRTEYWTGAAGAARFRCLSLERNEVVLDRGYVRFVS